MLVDDLFENVAGPEKCWPGHRKVGTKPGTGKNAGKRVNDCEKIKESHGDFNIGDPVIITGNVEYQGKTGDVREIGRDGAFVVVHLYNYGPYSFHASDVSLNDYADSDDENVSEGRVKELGMDLEDPLMSDEEFETKYGDSRANMQHRAGRVQDRKTGRFYDPEQEFDRLKNSPEFGTQMRRMAQRDGVAEAFGLYGPFTVTINTGERPQSRTKTKKFKREDDAILWAQDWLEDAPQYVFATAEVTDPDGNVVWTTDEQGVAEGSLDDIEDTRQFRNAIALAKSQKAIRHAKHGKDTKFYADGTPVTPEETARRAAERKARKQGVAEEEKVGNMPADKFDSAMARLKQLAGAGPLKTVWDPQKRVYKNVPTAVQPKK